MNYLSVWLHLIFIIQGVKLILGEEFTCNGINPSLGGINFQTNQNLSPELVNKLIQSLKDIESGGTNSAETENMKADDQKSNPIEYAQATCTKIPGKIVCKMGRFTYVVDRTQFDMKPEILERFIAMVHRRSSEGDKCFNVSVMDDSDSSTEGCPTEAPCAPTKPNNVIEEESPVTVECEMLSNERLKMCNPEYSPSEHQFKCKIKTMGIRKKRQTTFLLSVNDNGEVKFLDNYKPSRGQFKRKASTLRRFSGLGSENFMAKMKRHSDLDGETVQLFGKPEVPPLVRNFKTYCSYDLVSKCPSPREESFWTSCAPSCKNAVQIPSKNVKRKYRALRLNRKMTALPEYRNDLGPALILPVPVNNPKWKDINNILIADGKQGVMVPDKDNGSLFQQYNTPPTGQIYPNIPLPVMQQQWPPNSILVLNAIPPPTTALNNNPETTTQQESSPSTKTSFSSKSKNCTCFSKTTKPKLKCGCLMTTSSSRTKQTGSPKKKISCTVITQKLLNRAGSSSDSE